MKLWSPAGTIHGITSLRHLKLHENVVQWRKETTQVIWRSRLSNSLVLRPPPQLLSIAKNCCGVGNEVHYHTVNERVVLNQLGLSQLQLHYQTKQILLQDELKFKMNAVTDCLWYLVPGICKDLFYPVL